VRSPRAPRRFKELVAATTRPIFGAEPRELSLLFVLFYTAASGDEKLPRSFERNFNTHGGAQMWRFRGGYDRPLWREAGLNGAALDTSGPISFTFDDSPPGGGPGIVFGFVGGDHARRYATVSVN
jgi:hypothetical protein